MSHSATIGAEAHAAPKTKARNLSLDRARTFLTLVVLLHHAVIPYTYFGHTDPTSWIGFDMRRARHRQLLHGDVLLPVGTVRLAGHRAQGAAELSARPPVAARAAVRDRAFTVIPLAYYAIALRHDPGLASRTFWWKTITVGPWPSGPIWFVWVLLAFDLTASLLYRVSAHLVDPINRLSLRDFDRPAVFWLLLVVVTAIAYVPALLYFGGSKWFEFGPFSVQAQPHAALFAYFFIGVGVGAANFDRGSSAPTAGCRNSAGCGCSPR